MALEDDIIEQFQLFNIVPNDEVISKCLEMSLNYNVNAEELVEQWFAYTSSVLRGAAPTVEYLEKMARKEFVKAKEQGGKRTAVSGNEQSPQISSTSFQLSAVSTDVLGTPKGNDTPVSKIQTPVQSRKVLDDIIESTTSSPGTMPGIYSKRTDARFVRSSHGLKDTKFKREFEDNLTIKSVYEDNLKFNQRFMYEILGKRGRSINNMTEDVINGIKEKYMLDVNEDNENEVEGNTIFFGRIVSDSDGKLNNQSVLLELSQRNKGRTLYLNFSKISKYSLFPGQVVAVKGSYEKTSDKYRDKILVEKIYSETIFNLISEHPVTKGNLQLLIASGPFTTQDNLSFEPLNDILQYVKEYKPNVLLLMGPFYERTHPGIMNGELGQTLDSLFFDIVDNIMKTLENIGIHIIIVSSQKEPHHFPVYPTPPYEIRQKYENLVFMPDPCMVNVNGLIIGATTADILFNISNFEIYTDKTNSGRPDRMGRMASHLLKQQSFYPLDPPINDMCIDMSLMETNGIMAVKPHLLVLPSNLRHFVKEMDDCVIINPERLTKGNSGGTFARVEIRAESTPTICGRTACQILKI